MKTLITSILALLVAAGTTAKAQDEYLGLPGDNLNLYAVMNLFQESETLEAFEKNLNDENSRINNLDLNGDNYVDYITVSDYVDGDVHNIVLQDAVSPNEKQDVAVFTVQRLRDGSVQIQLIGDEALYGRNYIIEPIYDETPNPGYTGRRGNRNITVVHTTTFDIAAWPVIRFIYRPAYIGWHSSWHWGYYPVYWHSWSPFYYHYYYGYHHNFFPVYYGHYRHWDQPRYGGYHDYYYSHLRSHSPQVVVNINKGNYKTTYSRPQSRRDGEALYASTHSNRSSTTVSSRRSAAGNNTVNNSSRRSAGNSSERQATSSSRRSAGTYSNSRTVQSAGERPATSSSRRSAGTNSDSRTVQASDERSVNRSSTANSSRRNGSSSGTYSRPAATSENRVNTGRISGESSSGRPSQGVSNSRGSNSPVSAGPSTQRRSSAASPERSSSRREQSGSATPRASRQSSSSSVSKTERRSESRKTDSSGSKSQTSKDSDRQSRR